MDLTIKIVELIIQAIIGFGLVWVAIEANKIAKINNRRLSAEERGKIEEILKQSQNAFFIVRSSGNASDEAINLMFNVMSLSKIYLPKEVLMHIESFFKKFVKLQHLHKKIYDVDGNAINMDDPNRSENTKEITNILNEIHAFDIHELFSKYLKINE